MPSQLLVPRGVVANHQFAWDRDLIMRSNAQYVRSLVYNTSAWQQQLSGLYASPFRPEGTRMVGIATINNQHDEVKPDWSGWESAITNYAERIDPALALYVVLINEADGWGLDVHLVADLVNAVAPILHDKGFKVCLPSVSGEHWPDYLEELASLVDLRFIACCTAHFYGQSPDGFDYQHPSWGLLREAILTARNRSGLKVMLDEIGIKIRDADTDDPDDVGDENGQEMYVQKMVETVDSVGSEIVEAFAYFALTDQVGSPEEQGENAFGLVAADGRERPAYKQFQYEAAKLPRLETVVDEAAPTGRRDVQLYMHNRVYQHLNPELMVNLDMAICKYWLENAPEMGAPIDDEIYDDQGNAYQEFVSGVWWWEKATGTVARLNFVDPA